MADGPRAAERRIRAAGLPGLQVELSNQQTRHAVDSEMLIAAAQAVLADSSFASASISLAVVDDAKIHELNRHYLKHDWPTDVLSFVLGSDGTHLEGEVVISADTAASAARELGTLASVEQLLYVIHGTLHLVGHDDRTPDDASEMRHAEARYLRRFGFELPAAGREVG